MDEVAKVKPDSIGFDELMIAIRKGKVRIPDFQRDFVWELSQIIRLLDSIYNHYPVGSLLFWQTDAQIQAFRRVGEVELRYDEEPSVQYVLDGQQRLTSLFASLEQASIAHRINGKKVTKNVQIYFDLDENRFVSNPFEKKEAKATRKKEILRTIPGTEDYIDFLQKFLGMVDRDNPSAEQMLDWLNSRPGITSGRARSIRRQTQYMKLYLESEDGFVLTPQGRSLLSGEPMKEILLSLTQWICYFSEIFSQLFKDRRADLSETVERLSEVFDEQIKPYKIKARFDWLDGLGLGSFDKDEFSLSEQGTRSLKEVLGELSSQEEQEGLLEEEKKKRYFSVLQITDLDKFVETAAGLDPERRSRLQKVRKRFDSYPFSVIHVLGQPIETACEIFERINNSGKVLNVVDLMVAKSWSTTFNLRECLNKFRKELKRERYEEIPDITIIQCLSAIVTGGACRKHILEIERGLVEDNWKRTLDCIRLAIDFLKDELQVTHAKILPYNACLVPIASYFNIVQPNAMDNDKRRDLARWFWKVSLSNRYDRSADTKIGEDVTEMGKFARGEDAFFEYEPPHLSVDRIVSQKLNLGSAFCKTILCAFNQRGPKDFKDGAPVSLTSFSKFNSAELHHVFPVAYLRDKDLDNYSMRDSIANVALARSSSNKQHSSRPPSIYLKGCGNEKPSDALASHLIPDLSKSGLLEDDFKAFVDYRGQAILREVRKLSGDMTEVEILMRNEKNKPIDEFENGMRRYITAVLSSKHGDKWRECIPQELRQDAEDKIEHEVRKTSGKTKDDYDILDRFGSYDYKKIIIKNWLEFESSIKSKTDFKFHIDKIAEYRNPTQHVRDTTDVQKAVGAAAFTWFKEIFKSAGIS